MTGLDKILEEINADAQRDSNEIISNAETEAQNIIDSARKEADKRSGEIIEGAKRSVSDIKSRGVSSASLEENRAALACKQDIIGRMLSNALNYLENLDTDEYFDLILKLAEKNSQPASGKIAFSAKDASRLPNGFIGVLNSRVKGSLELSDEPAAIKSGFKLIYGGIEENCSFEAIFRSRHEELTDKISALLFEN